MADLPAGKAKLIQYLNEAYGIEQRLEVALEAHIGIATRPTYKKRLREHLTETRRHAREVSKRIKRLGGEVESIDLPGPEALGGVAQTAMAGVQRVAALAQGSLHALRGTGEEERQLKNAKTEYASEAEEIAGYSAILTVAEALGDRDTAKLARGILREEQRMRAFLEKEIPRMAGAVVRAEVPSKERAKPAGSRRRPSSAGRRGSSSARSSASARSGAPARSSAPAPSASRRSA